MGREAPFDFKASLPDSGHRGGRGQLPTTTVDALASEVSHFADELVRRAKYLPAFQVLRSHRSRRCIATQAGCVMSRLAAGFWKSDRSKLQGTARKCGFWQPFVAPWKTWTGWRPRVSSRRSPASNAGVRRPSEFLEWKRCKARQICIELHGFWNVDGPQTRMDAHSEHRPVTPVFLRYAMKTRHRDRASTRLRPDRGDTGDTWH